MKCVRHLCAICYLPRKQRPSTLSGSKLPRCRLGYYSGCRSACLGTSLPAWPSYCPVSSQTTSPFAWLSSCLSVLSKLLCLLCCLYEFLSCLLHAIHLFVLLLCLPYFSAYPSVSSVYPLSVLPSPAPLHLAVSLLSPLPSSLYLSYQYSSSYQFVPPPTPPAANLLLSVSLPTLLPLSACSSLSLSPLPILFILFMSSAPRDILLPSRAIHLATLHFMAPSAFRLHSRVCAWLRVRILVAN